MYHAVSTHHEYLLFQSPKAMSILVTKKALHHLNLEGKKMYS